MSIHIISAVLKCRDPDLTSSRRMVMVVLANYAGDTGRAWPSQQLIADETGCGVRSIKDHLAWLEAAGFITRTTKNLGQGNGSRTSYQIHLSRLDQTASGAGAEFAGAKFARANKREARCRIPHLTNRHEPSFSSVVLRERCFEAAGLDPQIAMAVPGLVSTIEIERLIRDPKHPCDLEQDVVPAIQACAATLRRKSQTITNWSYCHAAILRNRDQRLAGIPAPVAPPAAANGSPASRQKHSGGGVVSASLRLAAKLRESRGLDDNYGGEAEPIDAGGLGEVFSNHRRVAGPG